MGGRPRYVRSCTRHPGRYVSLRRVRADQATANRRLAHHGEVASRTIPGDHPQLPQRWPRFRVGGAARGRDAPASQVSHYPRGKTGRRLKAISGILSPSDDSSRTAPYTNEPGGIGATTGLRFIGPAQSGHRESSSVTPAALNSHSGHVPSSRKESYGTQNDLSAFLAS